MQFEPEQLLAELPPAGIARATRLGLALAPQMEPDSWRALVTHVTRLARTATGARQTLTAWLGDVLAYGPARGRGLITECAAAAGLDPGTLRNAKMVCLRIPLSCRHDALSWTHHCEVGLAFSEPGEIERWLAVAERGRLSAAELRCRVRAHLAMANRAPSAPDLPAAVAMFRLMRELRAVGRSLSCQRAVWRHWPPRVAQLGLEELAPVLEFVDTLRTKALGAKARPPADPTLN